MSTLYKTKAKFLQPIHQPKVTPTYEYEEQEVMWLTTNKEAPKPWNPFNTDFFHDSDTEDELPLERKNVYNQERISMKQEPIGSFDNADVDIEWDKSSVQIELIGQEHRTSSDDIELEEILRPNLLFAQEESGRRQVLVSNETPKLKRRNAMRRKKHPHLDTYSVPRTTTAKSREHN